MTTTVTIGRNVKNAWGEQVPMPTVDWQNFREEIRIACEHYLRAVYFKGEGVGWSEEWGSEDAYTLVCEGIPDWAYYSDFRDELLRIGNHYSQEAVAVTTGTTVFV